MPSWRVVDRLQTPSPSTGWAFFFQRQPQFYIAGRFLSEKKGVSPLPVLDNP